MTHNVDIIVVGAGLIGLSAAIAFAQQGRQVVLVDAKKPQIKKSELSFLKSWDERIYALTPATEKWLQALGVWQYVDKTRVNDIHTMHIWEDACEAALVLADSDANLSKLGLIVENKNLMQALWVTLNTLEVTVITDAPCKKIEYRPKQVNLLLENDISISAKLLLAADGADSFVRQELGIATKLKAFNQTALVANFLAEKNHDDVARQWFAPHETLALLPLPAQHVSMVWSLSTESATQLLTLTGEQLVERVQARSKSTLGALKPLGEVLSFTLNQLTATQLITERVALLGDAAHQIHPMAGQGVNLGFRDVMALQQQLVKLHALQDIGDASVLRQFERARKADIVSMNRLTSGLDFLFASEQSALKKISAWGMQRLNSHAIFKKVLIKQAVA